VTNQMGTRNPNSGSPTIVYQGRQRRKGQVRTRYVLPVAVIVAAAGWWGLYQFTIRVGPGQPGARLSFFILLFLTLTATFAPVAAYLNHRFGSNPAERSSWRFLRHSVWGALCLTSYAWLQTHRAFNLGFTFIIALIFLAIEVFILRMGGDS